MRILVVVAITQTRDASEDAALRVEVEHVSVGTAVVHGLVGPKHPTRSRTPLEGASRPVSPSPPSSSEEGGVGRRTAMPPSAKGTASGYSRTRPALRVAEQTGAIPDERSSRAAVESPWQIPVWAPDGFSRPS